MVIPVEKVNQACATQSFTRIVSPMVRADSSPEIDQTKKLKQIQKVFNSKDPKQSQETLICAESPRNFTNYTGVPFNYNFGSGESSVKLIKQDSVEPPIDVVDKASKEATP